MDIFWNCTMPYNSCFQNYPHLDDYIRQNTSDHLLNNKIFISFLPYFSACTPPRGSFVSTNKTSFFEEWYYLKGPVEKERKWLFLTHLCFPWFKMDPACPSYHCSLTFSPRTLFWRRTLGLAAKKAAKPPFFKLVLKTPILNAIFLHFGVDLQGNGCSNPTEALP